ncbi:uncharacterized protein [Spinacia oleracea]|uniref:Reverse transcriptase zinc-binding domain-containing protein n=1 Tax=Spinacia oleracea TaxID=3562 RepID=A0ABM3R3I6_SPIOL|nr:uncharacterized protein LOC130465450 [Spinacia oleracea]
MRFWWKGSANNKGICWTKRCKLEMPKGLGGVGLRNIDTYNKALLAKQAFRIHNNPSILLARVMKAAYKKSPVEAALNKDICNNASWGYKGLCKSIQEISNNVGRVIYRGNVDIRNGLWLPSKKVSFKNNEAENNRDIVKVKDLFHSQERRWNHQLIWATFSSNTARKIPCMHISDEDKEDQICWMENRTGQPTVKSIYNQLIMDKNLQTPIEDKGIFWKRLWKSEMIPKWRIFTWRLLNEAIATRSRLRRRGMMVDDCCVLCKKSQENDKHLFRDCPISSHVWKGSPLGINACVNQHIGIFEWIKNFMNFFWTEDGCNSPRVRAFIAILWSIWIHMNEVMFRNVEANPRTVMHLVVKHIKQAEEAVELKYRQGSKIRRQEEGVLVHALKGNNNVNHANLIVAGTWKKGKKKKWGEAAVGWCVMVDNRVIEEDGLKVTASDGHQAEIKAMPYGVQRATQLQIRSMKICTSSMDAIKALKNYPACRMDLVTICGDIIRISKDMDNCIIEKCKKEITMRVKNIAIGCRKNRY